MNGEVEEIRSNAHSAHEHEDDYGMNGDSNLSHSVRTFKQGKQSKDDDANSQQRRETTKTKDLQCMMTHALASTTLTDFPSVSRHFTHCHSALRVTNSFFVTVPIQSISELYANSLQRFTLRKWSCEVLSLQIHPLTRVPFSFRCIVYSWHRCCICCPSYVLRV